MLKYFILILLLASCSNEDVSKTPAVSDCSNQNEVNSFVYKTMLDKYFWYKEIPADTDYLNIENESILLDQLRYKPLDKFSFIINDSKYVDQIQNGQYIGYGFSLSTTPDKRVFIRYSYKDSPAFKANIKRSDEILELNGISVQNLISSNSLNQSLEILDINQALKIKLKKKNGNIYQLLIIPTIVTIDPVLASNIFSTTVGNVGYLAFNSFIYPANTALDYEFSRFSQANVKRLILDLRYNQGGLVTVAQRLASYLYGENNAETFTYLYHNDKNRAKDKQYKFLALENALNLDEIIFLISGETCSASEMLINSLRPFKNITAIGSTTCGKPVGMYGHQFCDKRLLMIEFGAQNAADQGIFFNGLSPICEAYDNIHYPLGDFNESLLSTALDYMDSRTCVWANRSKNIKETTFNTSNKDY